MPMHIHQPKHILLKPAEVKTFLEEYNIALSQLPKIKTTDVCVPAGAKVGDVLKIERKEDDAVRVYFRVVAE